MPRTCAGRRERTLLSALREAAAAETLREQAETDQLTGLSNRHGLINRIDSETGAIVRTVAVVDCDELKTVNDTLGHQAGRHLPAGHRRAAAGKPREVGPDRPLGRGRVPRGAAPRPRARHALPEPHAPRHRREVPVSVDGTMVDASVSIGVAAWRPDMTFDDALAAADRALYEAKGRGRNQIVTSS